MNKQEIIDLIDERLDEKVNYSLGEKKSEISKDIARERMQLKFEVDDRLQEADKMMTFLKTAETRIFDFVFFTTFLLYTVLCTIHPFSVNACNLTDKLSVYILWKPYTCSFLFNVFHLFLPHLSFLLFFRIL